MKKKRIPISKFRHYSITENGIIVNELTGHNIKVFKRNNYLAAVLSKFGTNNQVIYSLHRLLAITFLDNKGKKPIVNHLDGNKLNNSIDNLAWATYSENNKHAFLVGLNVPKRGAASHAAKLNLEEVKLIRIYLKEGFSQNAIAKKFNVSRGCIQGIHDGKTWKG